MTASEFAVAVIDDLSVTGRWRLLTVNFREPDDNLDDLIVYRLGDIVLGGRTQQRSYDLGDCTLDSAAGAGAGRQ